MKVGNDMARPLIIIGHSMGGIVVAKVRSQPRDE